MDNFYFCDPEKNTECSKEACYINGGQCKLTSKETCKKTATNQDKVVEIVRTKRSEKDRRIRYIYNKYEHIDYVDCVKKYLDSIK